MLRIAGGLCARKEQEEKGVRGRERASPVVAIINQKGARPSAVRSALARPANFALALLSPSLSRSRSLPVLAFGDSASHALAPKDRSSERRLVRELWYSVCVLRRDSRFSLAMYRTAESLDLGGLCLRKNVVQVAAIFFKNVFILDIYLTLL